METWISSNANDVCTFQHVNPTGIFNHDNFETSLHEHLVVSIHTFYVESLSCDQNNLVGDHTKHGEHSCRR